MGTDPDGGCGGRGGCSGGAVYTGRGPVCGTMMRRGGAAAGCCPGRGGRDVIWVAGLPAAGTASASGVATEVASVPEAALLTGGSTVGASATELLAPARVSSAGPAGAKDASTGAADSA